MPSFNISPNTMSISIDPSNSSQQQLSGTYSITAGSSPENGLVDVITDAGYSNDTDFVLNAPDASIAAITPPTWVAGQVTPTVITGSNFGNHPTIYISPSDITYTPPTFNPDGSVSTTVSVPASETAPQASVYIVPGNVGCTGNCYTSSDPGDPTAQSAMAFAAIVQNPSVSITSASIMDNQIAVVLAGSSSASGVLSLTLNATGSGYTFSYNSGVPVGIGSYTIGLPRNGVPVGTYTSLTATWAAASPAVSGTFSLTVPNQNIYPWIVLGTIRHSQYNTVYESACSGSQTAYIYDSNCNYRTVTLSSQFVSQTEENGLGISNSYGVLKYDDSRCYQSPNRPQSANSSNSLLSVSSNTGQCNTVLVGGDSVAVYPGPQIPGSKFNCGDDLTLVDSSNNNSYHKHVADQCAKSRCVDGHMDNYSSSTACSGRDVGDLPGTPLWTVDW